MHKAEIQAALKMAGVSQAMIADECGVTPTTVSDVIAGKRWSEGVAVQIAAHTGLAIEQLWPDRKTSTVRSRPIAREDASFAVLNEGERQLVQTFRTLNPAQQEQAKAMLTVIGLGLQLVPQSPAVTVTGGKQRIAGRDMITTKVGKKSTKK